MNRFMGVGYLVADLEHRMVGDKMVANGAIAIKRKYAEDKTDFINISIWGKGAEIALKYTQKGTMIAILGELQIEKKNDKIYTRINVEDFKFFSNKSQTIVKEEKQDYDFDIDVDALFSKVDEDTDLPF